MKYKSSLLVLILIVVQSVLGRDSHDGVRSRRRNSRRIDESNKLDKSVGESLLNDVSKQERSKATVIEGNKDEGRTVSDKAPERHLENKDVSLLSRTPIRPEIEQTGEIELLENINSKKTGNKRKRLIEVRKTKINTNEDDSENSFNERDKSSYVASRRTPDWAIPKKRQQSKPEFRILDMENYVYSNRGEFHYSYESADGTKAYERGQLRKLDDNSKGTAVFGGFSYKGKDGENYNLQYTADENGYRPVGDHLPTPPPIPPAIAKALFYLATKSPPPLPPTEEPYKYDYYDY